MTKFTFLVTTHNANRDRDETTCTAAKLPQGRLVCLSECRCMLQTPVWWRHQTMGGNRAERCQAGWVGGGVGGRWGCPGTGGSHEACTDFSPPAAHSLPSWCSSSPPAGAESCRTGPVQRGHPANTHVHHTHTRMCNRIVWASAIYMWQHCKYIKLCQRFNSLSIKHRLTTECFHSHYTESDKWSLLNECLLLFNIL